jgi:predicted NBD/HSP70 family sugar kinase
MQSSPRRTTRDLRRGNRAVLLRALYFHGPASRQDLARLTGLSAATVSNVTAELLAEGVLVDAGQVDSDGGRPRVLLRVNPEFGYVIGVDVGETWVHVELFDLNLAERAKAEYQLQPDRHDVETVVRHIVAGVDLVLAEVEPARTLGVGIGVPGIVEHGPAGTIHAQAFGWHAVPLRTVLRERLGKRLGRHAPRNLLIDNGAKTMGQAELWFGAGRGSRHAIVALIGSGVGACVVTDGYTYRGATSSAGEWGHTTIALGGRTCRCGARGCLETYIGAEGILDRYRAARAGRGGRAASVPDGTSEELALAQLLADAAPTARAVVDETVDYLGAGLANLINLFNPERIILGGWAGLLLGQHLLPAIRSAAAAHALAEPFAQVSIELGQLGPDAVAKGAATLVVEHFLHHSEESGSSHDGAVDAAPAGVMKARMQA